MIDFAEIWAIQGDEHTRNTQLSSRLTSYNDALFTKLEYIYQYCREHNIKRLVKLGDTATALNTDITDVVKNRYILQTRQFPEIEKATILGNHDMYEGDSANLYKTSMLTLALAGAFNLWVKPIRFTNIQVQVLDVQIEKSKQILEAMQESDVPTVIFGHHLYEWGFDKSVGLQRSDFAKFKSWKHPVTVFLGDDHTQYEPLKLENVTIHRLGSIMRTEKPMTSAPWNPRFALFNTTTLEVEYVKIPCEDYETAFGTPKSKLKYTKLAELNKLQESFDRLGTTDYSDLRPSKVLEKMGCPNEYMEYLRSVHTAQGENF